jgi:hypothetical protein
MGLAVFVFGHVEELQSTYAGTAHDEECGVLDFFHVLFVSVLPPTIRGSQEIEKMMALRQKSSRYLGC